MSKITLYYIEKYFIKCISDYVRTVDCLPQNFKVRQEEVDKREYYDCRWQKKKRTDTLFVECGDKNWDFETFGRFVSVKNVKRENNVTKHIQVARIAENLRAQDQMTKTQNVSKVSDVGNGCKKLPSR